MHIGSEYKIRMALIVENNKPYRNSSTPVLKLYIVYYKETSQFTMFQTEHLKSESSLF